MKNKFAWIYHSDCVAAAITEQMFHDFNLKKQEMTNLKREVSYAKMLEKMMHSRIRHIPICTSHQQN